MKPWLKITLIVSAIVIVLGGVIVGILAAVGVFSSDDNNSNSTQSSCTQCYTPQCSGNPSCNYASVSIVDGSGSTRFTITSNQIPCHELNGISIYVACPTPISVTSTIKTPSYCSTGNYYSGSACGVFNSQTVQPQFGDMGYIGRSTQKATHWSSTHVPLEAVS